MKCIFWGGWYRVPGGEAAVERLPEHPRAGCFPVLVEAFTLCCKNPERRSVPPWDFQKSAFEASALSSSFRRRHHRLQLRGQRGGHGGECHASPSSLLSQAEEAAAPQRPGGAFPFPPAFSLPSISQRLACSFLFPIHCSQEQIKSCGAKTLSPLPTSAKRSQGWCFWGC